MKLKKAETKSTFSLSSLLQLSVLIFGLVLAVLLTDQAQKYIGRATVSPKPKEVKITNVSESSFSVSWKTDRPSTGAVILKGTPERIFFDDRTGTYTTNSLFVTHHVTLKNLEPGQTYFFLIQSGKERYNSEEGDYQVTLPQPLSSPLPNPFSVYGKVLAKNQTPAPDTLVYLIFKEAQMLSTLTDGNGNFVLTSNNLRTKDFNNYYSPVVNETVTLNLSAEKNGYLKKEIIFSGPDLNLGNLRLLY